MDKIHIGYIHEFHQGISQKSWLSNLDLDSKDPTVQKDLQGWLFGLDEPWSDTSVSYIISPNHKNPTPETAWKVEYTSIFYDCLESVAISYGSTPQEAFTNVQTMVDYLIDKYYIRDSKDDVVPKPVFTEENLNKVKIMLGIKE